MLSTNQGNYKVLIENQSKEDCSPPWIDSRLKKSRALSREEALRAIQLRSLVEKERNQSYDYLLLRSSLSTNKVERKAWWILSMLFAFVEHEHRFPHMRELATLLDDLFSGKLKTGDLAPLSKQDLIDSAEIEKQVGVERIALKSHYKLSNSLHAKGKV